MTPVLEHVLQKKPEITNTEKAFSNQDVRSISLVHFGKTKQINQDMHGAEPHQNHLCFEQNPYFSSVIDAPNISIRKIMHLNKKAFQ